MSAFINFMNGGIGRSARIVLGLALIYVGLVTLGGGTTGYIVAAVGLVPIVLGVSGRCMVEFLPGA